MRERGAARSGTIARVLENAGWLLAGKGVGAVLSLVYLGLATRTLGPAAFGQFALILGTAQAISAFVSFQTWQLVVRYGMSHLQQGQADALARVTAFAYALDYGGALAGCLIAAVGVQLLGGHFGWSAALQREALLFAFVLLLSVRSTSVGILRLHDRFGTGAVADAVTPVMRLGGALIAVFVGATVTGFLIAWAASEIATAIAYRYFAAKVSGGGLQWPRIANLRAAVTDNPGLLRFAFVTNASSTLASLGKQLAILLVGLFAGPIAAGHYRLAYQLGQSLARVSEMLSRSVYAELTRVHFGDARENVAKLFRGAVRLSLIAGAIIVALLLLVGKPVLSLVAGPAYAAAYPLLLLLGIAAAIELGGVSFEPALVATGRAGQALKLRLVSSSLFLALLAILLPAIGATGAALASLAAAVTSLLLFGSAAWRALHR